MSKKKNPIPTKPMPKPIVVVENEASEAQNLETPQPNWTLYGYMAFLVVLVLAVFGTGFQNDFVMWDDQSYVVNNPIMNNPGLGQLGTIFSTSVSLNYHPLTILSMMLNIWIFGKDATSLIVTNTILHAANVVFVFTLVLNLTAKKSVKNLLPTDGNLWVAFFTALLYAIHPMRVESVIWVSERKDVLYGFFFFWACLMYLRYVDTGIREYFTLTFVLFVCSCLSKGQAVVLPLVLLLIDHWRGKGFLNLENIKTKWAFFAFALFIGITTISIQGGGDAWGVISPLMKESKAIDTASFNLFKRFQMGTYGFYAYLEKLFLPLGLSPMYPLVGNADGSLPSYYYLGLLVFPVAMSLALWGMKRHKSIFLGIGFYFFTVLLVLQFVSVGVAVMADRYSYLPYFGAFFLLVSLGFQWAKTQTLKYAFAGIVGVFAAWCTWLTIKQIGVWHDTATLYTRRIEVLPNDVRALEVRAMYYEKNNQPELSLADYEAASQQPTAAAATHDRLGYLLGVKGDKTRAVECFTKAINKDQTFANAYINRGTAFFPQAKAIPDFENALRFLPDTSFVKRREVKGFLGVCYANNGDLPKGLAFFDEVIDKDGSQLPSDYFNRALARLQAGNRTGAAADLQKLLQTDPNNAQAKQMLASLGGR